ncbi:AI-2E family transporter [Pedobacter hartonius]|uniref:Predicted PurR-regulated permease PerM n=1 Tax=Pedobacter hartonius TaxID=425514 RepID=A0A1H4HA49_9SPHI|nr:AI-2E family transporter [Pedobacter hartonius]SEB18511.1 Predicted PurR-regulated permease PerM [Pedobacter hartonius]
MPVKEYPFYMKSTVVLFGLILLTYTLSNLRDILTPLAFALIIAILLNPLVNRFQKRKMPKMLAIILSMFIALVLIVAVVYFLSTQIAQFGESFPMLSQKFNQLLVMFQNWLQKDFGISIQKQVQLINEAVNNSKALVGHTLGTAIGILGVVFLIPVYVFLYLWYKTKMLNFLYEVFAEENSEKVADVLSETKLAIQSYMVGLLIEAGIVAVMNSTALLLLGVKYAILFGVIGAILNMIPYIGGIVAILLPVLMATVTKDGYTTQLGIVGAYAVIQFIDNNFLVPNIVSSKVQINALVSILIVLLGNALWGVSGMFLSIPFVAILKIIFDRINELKPWGKLLGDEPSEDERRKRPFWKKNKDSVAEKIISKV